MSVVKDIKVKVIDSKTANGFIKKWHYSGKIVQNSSLHFGCFLNNILHGVLSYGSPMDRKKMLSLVEGTIWNEMIELNRMAFDDILPKNSESRCLAISFKLIKKNAPHIKWILSFADGTQSGDGAIYRAAGFYLTQIKKNSGLVKYKSEVISRMTLDTITIKKTGVGYKQAIKDGAVILDGFQLRYIYLLDKYCKITVPILPYSEIKKMNAGMYKGIKRVNSSKVEQPAPLEEDGAVPILTLHNNEVMNDTR